MIKFKRERKFEEEENTKRETFFLINLEFFFLRNLINKIDEK